MVEALSNDDVQIGITLASIAYLGTDSDPTGEFKAMAKALQQKTLPTKQQWGLVWGPANLDSNLMFIVQGPQTATGRKYALAIRGTIMTAESILEDLDLDLVNIPWTPNSAPSGAQISTGIATAFGRLLDMEDGGGRKAIDFLNGLGAGNELMVCGHSLGGCLTTVMSLYLKDTLKGWTIRSAPFAGQTAGTQAFASWYQSTFGSPSRWFNQLDIVPRLWNNASLQSISFLYPCDFGCELAVITLVSAAMAAAGDSFFQPGAGTGLPGQLYQTSDHTLEQWKDEAESQHHHAYYMYLTGIPLSVIQGTPFDPGLGAGWWPPGKHPVTARARTEPEGTCSS